MRICCFGSPAKSDAQEHDFSDLLASGATAAAAEQALPTAEIVTAPIADKQAQASESAFAEAATEGDIAGEKSADEPADDEADSVAADEIVLQPAVEPEAQEDTAGQTEQTAVDLQQPPEQVTPVEQQQHVCVPQEADPTVLMPAIRFFVHEVTDNQRLAVDQLASSVCQQLGEGAVRSVQGEYESEKPVPPSNSILGHLNKNFDFASFFKHAQQLPAQTLMVLLVLSGQKTSASKQQPVSVSLRKARRIRAAAEKYLSSNSATSSPQRSESSPRPQPAMDADRFKKLLLETDPAAYTMVDSSITQYNRDSYTGRDAILPVDTAAEVLATASAATRDQFSSRFSEASVDSQSSITYADMKKCLPAIYRLRHHEGSIIRALLRSETNDMSAVKGVAALRQFAAESATPSMQQILSCQ